MNQEKGMVCVALAIAVLLLINIRVLNACNACGGSTAGYNPDFTNYTRSHTVSFSNHIRLFDATVPVGHSLFNRNHPNDGHTHDLDLGTIDYDEIQVSYELRGTYYPIRNLALSAVLPFVQRQLFQEGKLLENQFSVGDILLLGQYHLINKTGSEQAKTGHRLSLGGGMKFPTAKFQMEGYNGVVEPTRQPGTGSFDFLCNVQYLFSLQSFGVNTFANYKANTGNKNEFRFGNMFNSTINMFYNQAIKSFGLIPNVGLTYEQTGKDRLHGEIYELDTGRKLLMNTFGMDIYVKQVGLSFTYFLPVYESLNGVQFENKHRFTISARYVFKDKEIKKD